MKRRSKFNLSHDRLLTCNMGGLYPIGLTEVLPNDSFQHTTSLLMRMSPLAAPVMHGVTIRVHHFFVPHRLAWGDACGKAFEDFITGGPDGQNAATIPTITTTAEKKSLLDYYGVPPVAGIQVSKLPIAGYNLIYNEFYRDQDLCQEREETDLDVAKVAWEKDYFTASRPFAQKGPEITLPITGIEPVPVSGIGVKGTANIEAGPWTDAAGNDLGTRGWKGDNVFVEGESDGTLPKTFVDLSSVPAASINDVRRAFALQRMQEARARFGSRYAEYLRYLGARPADARLRRPEFLAGGKQRVAISEVLQTANESEQARYGVGDMYGHGIAAMRSNRYRRHFQEHGYIHTLLSVRPRAMYTNGIHRTWLRQDKEDFYQPELEFIGQQEVMNNEVYADPVNGSQTFGYNDRYREYRENPGCVSGEFRDILNYWHLGREFASPPVLNAAFVECKPSDRIFNVKTEDTLWVMVRHQMVARRLLAKSAYGKII